MLKTELVKYFSDLETSYRDADDRDNAAVFGDLADDIDYDYDADEIAVGDAVLVVVVSDLPDEIARPVCRDIIELYG